MKIVSILICIALLLPVYAFSQDDYGMQQRVDVYDAVAVYPPPLWITSKEDLNNFAVFRNQTQNSFSLEQIPKGQKLSSWTAMHALYAWSLPEYTFERFVNESLNSIVIGCSKKPTFEALYRAPDNYVTTFHCGELDKTLVRDGNSKESGFIFMNQTGKTFSKVFMAWRGKKDENIMPKTRIAKAINAINNTRFIEKK